MKNDAQRPKPPGGDSPELDTIRLTATAYHEAGHAVMALVLGRSIEKVTISPARLQTGGSRLGACKLQKGRFKASHDALEDDALILLAGMVAESHFTGRYCGEGAAQDLRAVRQLLAKRAKNDRGIERLMRRLLDRTQHVLGAAGHVQAIQSVSRELLQRETISGRAVRHLLAQAVQ